MTMEPTLLHALHLEYSIIEIHCNNNLKNNQYLIRIFSYTDGNIEFRVDELGLRICGILITTHLEQNIK